MAIELIDKIKPKNNGNFKIIDEDYIEWNSHDTSFEQYEFVGDGETVFEIPNNTTSSSARIECTILSATNTKTISHQIDSLNDTDRIVVLSPSSDIDTVQSGQVHITTTDSQLNISTYYSNTENSLTQFSGADNNKVVSFIIDKDSAESTCYLTTAFGSSTDTLISESARVEMQVGDISAISHMFVAKGVIVRIRILQIPSSQEYTDVEVMKNVAKDMIIDALAYFTNPLYRFPSYASAMYITKSLTESRLSSLEYFISELDAELTDILGGTT